MPVNGVWVKYREVWLLGKIDDDAYNNHNQDIARRLIAQGGLTDEFIAMCSGLSAEEIEELKKETFGEKE